MTDQAFRSNKPSRAVEQFNHILRSQGIPRFLGPVDRALLRGLRAFGGYAPGIAAPLVKSRMRRETSDIVLPGEAEDLQRFLRQRRAEGVRMNVNFLGEAMLSEEEVANRIRLNLAGLQLPEVEVISLKISTLYSQISGLARDHTIATLSDLLELFFRSAARFSFVRLDGTAVPKFIYLDMEEYRDMSLTAEVFIRALSRPGLEKVSAGIALQAYIPDSFRTQKELNAWARRRVAAGGAPVTLRIVKGANLEMERVEASLKGWPQAPFKTKLETDANFKRMIQEAIRPQNISAVRLGVASHNLFDLAYALVLAVDNDLEDKVQFEMLEGMANPERRALFELAGNILVYAPVFRKENFISAIGYLIRRLDENTGPENFLRYAFRIKAGGLDWERLERGFRDAFAAIEKLSESPRRTQNRLLPPPLQPAVARGWQHFVNEPDTDFSLPHNSEWAKRLIANWESRHGEKASEIPLVLGGEDIFEGRPTAEHDKSAGTSGRAIRNCPDPSRPGFVVGRFRQATEDDIEAAIKCALADEDGWRRRSAGSRHELLGKVAEEIRLARADLVGAALASGGKTISESDPEVSEAVDFVEFYRDTASWWQEMPTLVARPRGVVVVVSPFNFPISIPCGGVAAALAAGNSVILKPSSEAVLVAWELAQCFWRAGVSKKTLQFVPCAGGREGRRLVTHPGVDAVILTGGTETAIRMLRDKPSLSLHAETGGKNATVVTAMADRDQAIVHVIHSAFSHAGQKCSATSLLLLEAEVYDDAKFKRSLCDAIQSVHVGSAWDLKTKVGPLIRPPAGPLENALKVLEPGESWAVLPRRLEDNPNLWSPGLKYGVRPGSTTHMVEFFGPVLGVMRFERLAEAIDLVNQTGYGLTSGLESLDDREQEEWKAGIRAGNLYINRTTVGAVVLRQPFGGMGKSAFGPGIKAGGPNYVAQFMKFTDAAAETGPDEKPADSRMAGLYNDLYRQMDKGGPIPPAEWKRLLAAVTSYGQSLDQEFGRSHDHFNLVGQDNHRRYLPVRDLRIRIHPDDSAFETIARVSAARAVGCHVSVSFLPGYTSPSLSSLQDLARSWRGDIEFVEESDDELAAVVRSRTIDRIRCAAPARVPPVVQQAAAESGIYIAARPVQREGRLELLWYVREQSVSFDYHRYGNLGSRAAEARAEIL